MFKKIIILLLGVSAGIVTGTCTYTWQATPDPMTHLSRCDPHHIGAQMIQVPLLKSTWQTVHDCNLHNPEKVAIAITVFYNSWRLKFGETHGVWEALNNLLVEWSDEKKSVSGYNIHGNKFIDSPIVGLARTPTWIWVQTSGNDRICDTAFIHELVHISIWALTGTGDPDHEGGKYYGWTPDHTTLIKEVNAVLCGLGI